ncbi:MAG: alanine--glyoxylate aminotransferase family protein [bacterium]|nr:alanine--glyoxylate aminotransferase family protein [bacterium]
MALLNMSCGQTALHPDALKAMGTQIEGPIYFPPYWRLEIETTEYLQQLLNTNNDILLIAGSATYGEEAALLSLLEAGQKVLVVDSGMYGQVLIDLTEIVGCSPVPLKPPTGRAVAPEMIRSALEADSEIAMVAVVHCDTSTGIINPLSEIGSLLKNDFQDVLFLVDAVSSAGAVEIRVDDWNIDLCITSAQKCINGPQGIAILSVSQHAWDVISGRSTPIQSLCLDLTVWKEYHDGVKHAYSMNKWSDISTATVKAIHGPSPSYTLVAGLHAALKAILGEGLKRVLARHEIAARAVRAGIRAMGIRILADEKSAAPVSTALIFSEEVDWTALASKIFFERNIALASGFRIGTMGQSACKDHVLTVLRELEQVLTEMGHSVLSGIAAAQAVYSDEKEIS